MIQLETPKPFAKAKGKTLFNEACPACRNQKSGENDVFHWIMKEDKKKVNKFNELKMKCDSNKLFTSSDSKGFNAVFNTDKFTALQGLGIIHTLLL